MGVPSALQFAKIICGELVNLCERLLATLVQTCFFGGAGQCWDIPMKPCDEVWAEMRVTFRDIRKGGLCHFACVFDEENIAG